MKKTILFMCFLFLLICFVFANDKDLILIPYAVPDFPAMKALNISNTDDLSAFTSQELAAILSNYYDGQNTKIPANLAVEFCPFTMFSPKLDLRSYLKQPRKYDFSISLASTTVENVRKASLGLRIPVYDRSGISNSDTLEAYVESLLEYDSIFNIIYIEKVSKGRSPNDKNLIVEVEAETNAVLKSKSERVKYGKMILLQAKNPDVMNGLRKILEDTDMTPSWSKSKFQLAFAVVGNSPDSLVKNIQLEAIQGWLVGSTGFRFGEFVLSPSFRWFKEGKYYNEISVPLKINFGTNDAKFALLGQYLNSTKDESNLLTGKMELYKGLTDYLGLDLNLGYTRNIDTNKGVLESDFKLKYSLQK